VREASETLTRGHLRCIRAIMSPDQWQEGEVNAQQKITPVRETPEERTMLCRRDLEIGGGWSGRPNPG
jgi:hypothetical protein